MSKTKRIAGLDIIRTFAILFVIFVHAFLKIGFYDTHVSGSHFFVYITARTLFFICVPLFMLLTGYLQCNKKPEKSYYITILPILVSYIFISILCILVNNLILGQHISVLNGFFSIMNFTANSYAWYVEMFIGLFLLAPFLNIIYKGIVTLNQKLLLLLTLLSLTSLPLFLYSFNTPDKIPLLLLLPKYWTVLYPITYYFIGCFIREYQPKLKKSIHFLLLSAYLLLYSAALFVANYGKNFSWRFLGEYGGLTTVILAVLFFLFFYDVDIKSKLIKNVIKQLSVVSFDMYLFSNIFDSLLYPYYFRHFAPSLSHVIFTAPIVIVLSLTAAELKQILFYLVKAIWRKSMCRSVTE